jgi:hypothetical protein
LPLQRRKKNSQIISNPLRILTTVQVIQ